MVRAVRQGVPTYYTRLITSLGFGIPVSYSGWKERILQMYMEQEKDRVYNQTHGINDKKAQWGGQGQYDHRPGRQSYDECHAAQTRAPGPRADYGAVALCNHHKLRQAGRTDGYRQEGAHVEGTVLQLSPAGTPIARLPNEEAAGPRRRNPPHQRNPLKTRRRRRRKKSRSSRVRFPFDDHGLIYWCALGFRGAVPC